MKRATFYRICRNNTKIEFVKTKGYLQDFTTTNGDTITVAIHNTDGKWWNLIEISTGFSFGKGGSTRKKAFEIPQKLIDDVYTELQKDYYKQYAKKLSNYIVLERNK